jgi:arylsulfatase A-like enzyme
MPVLNEGTLINHGFDFYRLREKHNDLAGIIDDLRFYDERPSFWMINTGETHYPYEIPGEKYELLPRLSGLHGTVKRLSENKSESPEFFSDQQLEELRHRQINAVTYIDSLIPSLRDMVPDNTWLTVTADHGECFGEEGYFGHGPIQHPKVLEVPLLEGKLR